MTPEWDPDMEELNKRRVERHLRRQKGMPKNGGKSSLP